MSRSGYILGDDHLEKGRWQGQVLSSLRGKRGRKLLTDLRTALDAMPQKRLIANQLETSDGELCALGVLGKARGLNIKDIDPEDSAKLAVVFDIAKPLAREIVFMNDEFYDRETPEQRFQKMRDWVIRQILRQPPPGRTFRPSAAPLNPRNKLLRLPG